MAYIIEATWTGHSTHRIVHRTIHPDFYPKLREWAFKNKSITFTDGTQLILSVRDSRPGEQIDEDHGYEVLINDCCRHNVCSVRELLLAQKNK